MWTYIHTYIHLITYIHTYIHTFYIHFTLHFPHQEINEDSIHSRANVRSWLVKLPKERFDLVLALFALLQRIATVGT